MSTHSKFNEYTISQLQNPLVDKLRIAPLPGLLNLPMGSRREPINLLQLLSIPLIGVTFLACVLVSVCVCNLTVQQSGRDGVVEAVAAVTAVAAGDLVVVGALQRGQVRA